jgi:hypothetical protein
MWQWARDRATDERARLDAEEEQAWQASLGDLKRREMERRRN